VNVYIGNINFPEEKIRNKQKIKNRLLSSQLAEAQYFFQEM